MPLGSLLQGYEAAKQGNQAAAAADLQQFGSLQKILATQQAMQQEAQMRALMTQTGGDPEKAMEVALKTNNIAAAHQLAPLVKMAQEKRLAQGTVEGLTALNAKYAPGTSAPAAAEPQQLGIDQPIAPEAGAPPTAPASPDSPRLQRIAYLKELGAMPKYANNPIVQQRMQAEIDRLQNIKPMVEHNFPVGENMVQPHISHDEGRTWAPILGSQPSAKFSKQVINVGGEDKPLTDMAKLNADLAAGRITQAQFDAASNKKLGDPNAVLTPEAVTAAAARYRIDGTLPPSMGRGTQGAVNTAMILKEAAASAAEDGVTPEAQRLNQVANKASAQALGQLVKQKNLILAFEKTAQLNANLVLQESEKVDRLGSPAVDRWLQAGQKNVLGDPAVARLHLAVRTFVNEYARVTTSVTGGGITSDTARKEIEDLLRAAHTKEQVREVISLARTELGNRKLAYEQQERELKSSITTGSAPAQPTEAPTAISPPSAGGWSIRPK